ncbi:MAG: ammonium transporter [Phycisphaerales bacterium]|jgi:Amt family ammonium transporter|nr:ammonium transporter [Phycisphaerales bacterium]
MELIALAVAALLVRVGVALYATGTARAKNSGGAVLRVIADLCVTVLAFWAFGAAFLFGEHRFAFSVDGDFLFGRGVTALATATILFHLAMILTASAAVGLAVAERGKFFVVCAASLVLAGFILPVTGQWAWSGWLWRRGYFDLAGASTLHVAVGVFAAVGVAVVGPRTGKFNRDGSSAILPGHNLPLLSVGALTILVGWVPYIAGAGLAHLRYERGTEVIYAAPGAFNVLLAAAAAGLASLVYSHLRYGKPDIMLTVTGLLGGLVAVSAGATALPAWGAVVVGAVAGTVVPLSVVMIDLRGRLDDPGGIIAIHGIGGVLGTLAVAFVVPAAPLVAKAESANPPGSLARAHLQQLGIQFLGIGAIAVFSGVVALILFLALKKTVGVRANDADEFDGLDLAEHDIGAYPDFQQTTIKSYHLREV